ncbi:TPA: pyruvyl transferase [Clostridium perfringens]|uniref:polysaccharide pyruvyl transferase family protein n=1 Tax=Clostridium perfringens TaxID=1502 RepID=UPI001A24C275|nr:polysaccharide pyruvyl transferase family protein [Clostridium perfringens]MDV5102919.1 polysaccharide pyruvyl transferase family protein [Clostridium perfringens]HAT4328048.1 pyruvyl transferase [Clostridium perfringens]
MSKLRRLKVKIAEIVFLKYGNKLKYINGKNKIKEFQSIKNKKKVILTLTPNHGNLGDHAIAYASEVFIKENFSDYEFIELDINEIYEKGKALKNILGEDDIIMILGGGNIGDLYKHEEWTRRFIVNTFKGTKIISLPQTICFSETNKGKTEFNKTKKIYNKNNNLKLVAREKVSFDIMKKSFGESRVGFYPDMVLSLNKRNFITKRDGILMCLRSDKEGVFKSKFKEELNSRLKEIYSKVELSDTVITKNVDRYSRNKELDKIWRKMSSAEVVITDRLHGMIFCAITNTPCIVLKTYNHKVIQAYKWLENQANIVLVEDIRINSIIDKIEFIKNKNNNINFEEKFLELVEFIKK